jgi:hypothetical protein
MKATMLVIIRSCKVSIAKGAIEKLSEAENFEINFFPA